MARGVRMRISLFGREADVPMGRALSVALVMIGVVFAAFAIDAQGGIDDIGETNDSVLQNRIAGLQNDRDAYMVCAVGFAFLGLFGFFTLVERGSPAQLSEEQMKSAARTNHGMVRGLALVGNASYLPASHGLTKERVFVHASASGTDPPTAVSDDMVVAPGKDGSSPGMLIEPPGLSLLDSIERDFSADIAGADLGDVEGSLQVLKHSLNLLKDFHFKERGGKTVLRVEYGSLLEACRSIRRDTPDVCRQVQCIGCSCLLVAAARSTNKVVRVEDVDTSDDTVVFTLLLIDW